MAAVLYGTAQHQRYKSLLVIVIAVVGASILTGAPQDGTLQNERQGSTKVAAKRTGLWSWWPAIAASVLFLVTCVRIVDLVSSRSYIVDDAESSSGLRSRGGTRNARPTLSSGSTFPAMSFRSTTWAGLRRGGWGRLMAILSTGGT